MSIVERAFDVYYATMPRAPRDRLAHPFGAGQHDPYRWRVSQDVWDALKAYVGPWVPAAPLTTSTLLGEPIEVDEALPPNSMVLEPSSR